MFVHIHLSKEDLDRRPWIAVWIGMAGVVLMALCFNAFWKEHQSLRRLSKPTESTIAAAALPSDQSTQWITLIDGIWHCDQKIEYLHDIPERWILGRIDYVQIPLTDANHSKLIVLKHDGPLNCPEIADKPVTGLLTSEGDQTWGSFVADSLKKPEYRPPILVLHMRANPHKAKILMLASGLFLLVFVIFSAYF